MKNEKEIKKLEKAVEDINKRIDKLKEGKPELEVDRWYRNGNLLFYVTQIHDKQTYGYGFDHGEWDKIEDTMSGGWTFELDKSNTPATNEEVEAALIAEAKKRGFKEGVSFKSCEIMSGMKETTVKEIKFDWHGYDKYIGVNMYSNDGNIFYNGNWAEIIEEPKVVINGYEMKQECYIVSFGCAKFHEQWFEKQLKAIDNANGNAWLKNFGQNRKIESITLDSGVEITVKQLQEIVDNIK